MIAIQRGLGIMLYSGVVMVGLAIVLISLLMELEDAEKPQSLRELSEEWELPPPTMDLLKHPDHHIWGRWLTVHGKNQVRQCVLPECQATEEKIDDE